MPLLLVLSLSLSLSLKKNHYFPITKFLMEKEGDVYVSRVDVSTASVKSGIM